MQPRTNKVTDELLNKYSRELMLCLPDHASQLIEALAEDHLAPVWQVFCGIVLEVHMQGNLSNFTIDPAWAEGLKQYDYVCQYCGQAFKPVNLGQPFCSNECGQAAAQKPKEQVKNDKPINTSTAKPVNTNSTNSDAFASRLAALTKTLDGGWSEGDAVPSD